MTTIIMVRHGQSVANLEERFAGYSDFDLTDLGRRQAELAAEYLYNSGQKVDAIYASDLLRAHNTALPFAKKYGLPINDTTALREIYAGEWEGLKFTEIMERFTEDRLVWKDDFANSRCTGGESTRELFRRIVKTVKELAEANPGKTVLLATHATPVRAIDCLSRGWGEEMMGELKFVKNSAISIFEYADGVITPVRVGITEHLDESLTTMLPKTI